MNIEIRKKISDSQKKYYDENPDKIPYKLYHASKQSYPELTFEKYLKEYNIEGWVYNYQFGRYNFDFAFPEWKLDIEIDGNTHDNEKVKQKDKERDEYTISKGWSIIRFKASDIRENVYECINIVLQKISYPKLIEIPQEFLNKKLEQHLKKEKKQQEIIQRHNNHIEKEKKYVDTINNILKINKNEFGIIQLIAQELNLTHTSVRNICKRNNINVFKRDKENNIILIERNKRIKEKEIFIKNRIDQINNIINEYGLNRGLLSLISTRLNIKHTSVIDFCKTHKIKLK